MNLWIIFLTGLTVGGLTCLAVQGGLLASTIAAREEEDLEEGKKAKHNFWPTMSFLITKFVAYTILGFLLGSFGQATQISGGLQTTIQFLAGSYMIFIALNLLNVHPIFRYAIIQPPRFLTRMVRNQSKSKDLFAPGLLGAMTIFIPCGTTLAMEALAISSGSAISGALIMATFILGTMPLFLGIGFLTTVLGDTFKGGFFKLAGVLVLYLGVTSLNGALLASGSPLTLQTIYEVMPFEIDLSAGRGYEQISPNVKLVGETQVADIAVLPNGYSPNYLQVKANTPLKLNLSTTNKLGCTSYFRIPKLGISKTLPKNSTQTIEFTPTEKGKIAFTCSMGMYSGVIDVI